MTGYCIDLPIPFEGRVVVAGIAAFFVTPVIAELIKKFWPKYEIRDMEEYASVMVTITIILSFVIMIMAC